MIDCLGKASRYEVEVIAVRKKYHDRPAAWSQPPDWTAPTTDEE